MSKIISDKKLHILINKYGNDTVITFYVNDIIKLNYKQKKILGIGGVRD